MPCLIFQTSKSHLRALRRAAAIVLVSGGGITASLGQATGSLTETNAEDISLEQLVNIQVDSVYGASRYDQKVTEAPASVSIVTADEIKKFGYRTLSEVLRSVRGLYVADDRNYTYLGIRGFLRPGDYNTRVLVLVDGHRMNDNVYDSAYFGRENTIDVDLVERVEVIRGPGSSIYGNSAFFGVVNVVTKRGRQFDGAEASAEAGSFDSYKGRFSYGELFKNEVELLFSGSYYTSAGEERLYYPEFDQRLSTEPRATHNGIAENLDREEAYNLFTSASYHELTLSGMFTARTRKVPTASFGTIFNDGGEQTTDYRAYVDLKLDHAVTEDIQLLGRVFYDAYIYYGEYPYNMADPGDPVQRLLEKDEVLGDWTGTEWQLTSKVFDQHRLILGGEYRQNLRQHQAYYYDVTPRSYYFESDNSSSILGVYGQGELALLTNLTLNAGLRYDQYFEEFGGTLNPRLALIYSPWEGSAFKALYGEAFRAPNEYEQSYYQAQRTLPELQPEKIRTYELVFEQYFARHYRVSLSGYHYDLEDLISVQDLGAQAGTPGENFAFANLDKASAHGGELELEGKFDSGLMARASYALQRAEDEQTGEELSNSPCHLAKFNVSVPLYEDKVFAGVELQYQGEVRTLAGRRNQDFVLANLTLFSQQLLKNLEFSASIYNLLGTRYSYPGSEDQLQDVIPQMGRTFRLKLTYRF